MNKTKGRDFGRLLGLGLAVVAMLVLSIAVVGWTDMAGAGDTIIMPDTVWCDFAYEGSSFGGGDGSIDNPWLIESGAQLARVAKEISKAQDGGSILSQNDSFGLAKDIDLSAHRWSLPIGFGGSNAAVPSAFLGTFDGNNYTIRGLMFAAPSGVFGLFGFVGVQHAGIQSAPNGTIIRNLTIDDAAINVSSHGGTTTAGVLMGRLTHGVTVDNVTIGSNVRIYVYRHDVTAGYSVGGIAGRSETNTSVIRESRNKSTLTIVGSHLSNSGGLVGRVDPGFAHSGTRVLLIESSANYGDGFEGGLVGNFSASNHELIINDSNNRGIAVSGGFVASVGNSGVLNILRGRNYGSVTGLFGAGGFVGSNSANVTIRDSYNYGEILPPGVILGNFDNPSSGGLLGSSTPPASGNSTTTIIDSHNRANVRGMAAGGIAGHVGNATVVLRGVTNTGTIMMSHTNISNPRYLGGIVGRAGHAGSGGANRSLSIENSANYGEIIWAYSHRSVTMGGIIGGIGGAMMDVSLQNVRSVGDITLGRIETATGNSIGGIVGAVAGGSGLVVTDSRAELGLTISYHPAITISAVHLGSGGAIGRSMSGSNNIKLANVLTRVVASTRQDLVGPHHYHLVGGAIAEGVFVVTDSRQDPPNEWDDCDEYDGGDDDCDIIGDCDGYGECDCLDDGYNNGKGDDGYGNGDCDNGYGDCEDDDNTDNTGDNGYAGDDAGCDGDSTDDGDVGDDGGYYEDVCDEALSCCDEDAITDMPQTEPPIVGIDGCSAMSMVGVLAALGAMGAVGLAVKKRV